MFHHQTSILNDVDARGREALGERLVRNARLEPDGGGMFGQDILEMGLEIGGLAEDIDEIDDAWNVDESPEHRLVENGGDVRVIHWHRNDLEPLCIEISRDLEGGLASLRFCLDAQYGDALRSLEEGWDIRITKEVRSNPGRWRAHGASTLRQTVASHG